MAQDGRLGGGKKHRYTSISSATYIYIYTFCRRFYPKRLTVHSGYTFFFCQYVFPLVIEPTTFCAAKAMLYHWAP